MCTQQKCVDFSKFTLYNENFTWNIIKFGEDKFLFLKHSLEGGLVKIVEGANNTVHFAKKSTVTSMVQDYMTIFPSAANDKWVK